MAIQLTLPGFFDKGGVVFRADMPGDPMLKYKPEPLMVEPACTVYSIPSGQLFELPEVKQMMADNKRPLTDEERLARNREELRLIAESAKYDSMGNEL